MFTNPLAATATRRRLFLPALLTMLAAALGITENAFAQTWTETGDAGDLPGTAQVTAGTGSLATINGNLSSPSDVDMYCIRALVPTTFRARLQCVAIQGPNVWLFDATGKGVAANSFCVAGDKQVTPTFVFNPGQYYLAVSYNNVNPFSGADPIWVPANTGERAPDGAGAAGVVTSWQGTGQVQPINPYTVLLTSVGYCTGTVPTDKQTWGNVKVLYQ